jgi:hypothetical protein
MDLATIPGVAAKEPTSKYKPVLFLPTCKIHVFRWRDLQLCARFPPAVSATIHRVNTFLKVLMESHSLAQTLRGQRATQTSLPCSLAVKGLLGFAQGCFVRPIQRLPQQCLLQPRLLRLCEESHIERDWTVQSIKHQFRVQCESSLAHLRNAC